MSFIINMEKYLGNKKVIVDEIESFLKAKGVEQDIVIDAFAGTTNVGQYFKQKGYSVISNDVNEFSFILGKVYLENNEFPKFEKVIKLLIENGFNVDYDELNVWKKYIQKKVMGEKIYSRNYYEEVNYNKGIEPLLVILQYLNNLNLENYTEEEMLFLNYYTIEGEFSSYRSSRGTEGKRNYFSPENAKRLGKIMVKIKEWVNNKIITKMEEYILLACVIEEVTLNANVSGTFHDFNRNKLYPNAEARLYLKPIMFNIAKGNKTYKVFKEDANNLHQNSGFKKIDIKNSILYIDPPYNFRQYSAYYHLLNFIAIYNEIQNVLEYARKFEFVRGQNMENNFISRYCYRSEFINALTELIDSIKSKHILISYYDENNHWNHGKEIVSDEGRKAVLSIFSSLLNIRTYDKVPFKINRKNYQSQSGARKKNIDELLFYGVRENQ